jgi:hypothetical protein
LPPLVPDKQKKDIVRMQTYPMVHALVRHGGMAAALVGAATVALGAYAAMQAGSLVWALVGALGGALIYALLKSYSELVTIIADMMLPK